MTSSTPAIRSDRTALSCPLRLERDAHYNHFQNAQQLVVQSLVQLQSWFPPQSSSPTSRSGPVRRKGFSTNPQDTERCMPSLHQNNNSATTEGCGTRQALVECLQAFFASPPSTSHDSRNDTNAKEREGGKTSNACIPQELVAQLHEQHQSGTPLTTTLLVQLLVQPVPSLLPHSLAPRPPPRRDECSASQHTKRQLPQTPVTWKALIRQSRERLLAASPFGLEDGTGPFGTGRRSAGPRRAPRRSSLAYQDVPVRVKRMGVSGISFEMKQCRLSLSALLPSLVFREVSTHACPSAATLPVHGAASKSSSSLMASSTRELHAEAPSPSCPVPQSQLSSPAVVHLPTHRVDEWLYPREREVLHACLMASSSSALVSTPLVPTPEQRSLSNVADRTSSICSPEPISVFQLFFPLNLITEN